MWNCAIEEVVLLARERAKKGEEKKENHIHVRIDSDLNDKFTDYCKEHNSSKSEMIIKMIRVLVGK